MSKLLFCTDTDSGSISVIELEKDRNRAEHEIAVGNGPRGPVMFTKNGRGLVANHAGNTLSEIDAYSLRETGRIEVGLAPIGVAIVPGDRYALTSNAGEDTISVVDLGNRKEVHRFIVGREPRHMGFTPDGNTAYAAISGADYVSKIDTIALAKNDPEAIADTVREVARIYLGRGTMPYSVAVSPNGAYALAANNQVSFVTILDLKNDSILHEVEVGSKGARGSVFMPDSRQVLVTIEDTSEIVAIDTAKGEVLERFAAGPGPRGIVLDPDTSTIYASAFARKTNNTKHMSMPNSVSVLHFSPKALTKTAMTKAKPEGREIKVGAGPCSVSLFQRT